MNFLVAFLSCFVVCPNFFHRLSRALAEIGRDCWWCGAADVPCEVAAVSLASVKFLQMPGIPPIPASAVSAGGGRAARARVATATTGTKPKHRACKGLTRMCGPDGLAPRAAAATARNIVPGTADWDLVFGVRYTAISDRGPVTITITTSHRHRNTRNAEVDAKRRPPPTATESGLFEARRAKTV